MSGSNNDSSEPAIDKLYLTTWILNESPNGMAKLAGRAGISLSTLNGILRGNYMPRLKTIAALAKAMGVHPKDLILWDNQSERKAS